MTAQTIAPVERQREATTQNARVTFGHLLKAEWIGLTSLRATLVSLIIGVLLTIVASAGMSAMLGFLSTQPDQETFEPPFSEVSMSGIMIAVIVAVIIGVASYTKEHSTGTLRTYFTAAPNRIAVLGAKTVIVFVTTFVAAAVTLALSFAAVAAVFTSFGLPTLTGSLLTHMLLPILGGALYVAASGVLGLGLGALLRSETWAMTVGLVYLLLLPGVFQMLPFEWAPQVAELLLPVAGGHISAVHESFDPAVLGDIALVIGWPVAALIAGAAVIRSRDA